MPPTTGRRTGRLIAGLALALAVATPGIATSAADDAPAAAAPATAAEAAPSPVPAVTTAVRAAPEDHALPDDTVPAPAPPSSAAADAAVPGPAAEAAESVPAPSTTGGAPSDPDATPPVAAGTGVVDRAATTGVPAGIVLTPMAGGTVPTTGTIADRVITGDVVFTGSGLTVRNVRVTGHAVFRGDDLVIEDSEFGSWALSGTERVRAARIDVFGNPAQDGLHVTADVGPVRDVVVADSWIHNPLIADGSHYDGIQVRGVDGLTVRNLLIDLGDYATGQNAALFLENANGGNRNVLVQDSQLLGGGYTVASYATDVRITQTVIRAGRWGYLNPTSWPLTAFDGNSSDAAPLSYDGTSVAVSGPTIVECWPMPDPAP